MNTSLEPRISTHSRKSTSKSFTEFKSTPVILVCIYNRGNSLITHDFLYQLFSPHGRVLRILIFEKLNVWKAFIEFSNAESAKEAKQSLDDVEIFEDGSKINIYFSTLSCIKFQNKNTGGKDFTTLTENPRTLVKNPIRMNSYDSFDMFLRTEVTKVTLEDNNQPLINAESNLTETDNQQREDEIFNIVNSFKEKIIIDEDEETPDTDPDDLEKDDLSKFFNVFQKDITTPKDFTPSQTYIKASDPFSKPDIHNSPFNYSAISRPFEGSGPLQRLGNPISSLPMSKSISNYNRQFSISRCSTLSEIPDHTNPIRHPLSRMTSFEDVISQPRTLQRHKTSIELNAPSYNMQKSNEGYYHFINQCPQPLTKFPSSNAIGMINPMTYSPMHNDHQYSKESKTPKSQFSFKHNEENNNPNMMNTTKPSGANPFENYDDKKSQVLYVKGLNHPDIKVHMIYNMFSNFGNLLRIIFIRNKAVALLEFENEEYSTVAKEYLNNIVFMGYPLRIYYSNYSVINLSNKRHSTEIEEVFRGTPKTFRFKKNGNVSINPPSSTLHLSNLTKEACTEEFIKEYFQLYGRIESIRFLHIENTKNMCLLKLASIEESVNALAHLHDTNFHGRNIQISFSRSKI